MTFSFFFYNKRCMPQINLKTLLALRVLLVYTFNMRVSCLPYALLFFVHTHTTDRQIRNRGFYTKSTFESVIHMSIFMRISQKRLHSRT